MSKAHQNLLDILMTTLGGRSNIAKFFNVSPQAVSLWRQTGVPEKIALLSHLSAKIPFQYNPSDYNRDEKGLGIKIKTTKKVTTNDHTKHIRKNAA